MITETTFSFPFLGQNESFTPTRQCFDWCKEQHHIFQSNTKIENLILLFFALASLTTYYLLVNFAHPEDEETQKIILKLQDSMLVVSIFLISAFVWLST